MIVAYPRLHKAIRFAAKKHRWMDRDGEFPLPYVTHPIEVCTKVRFDAGVTDEDVLCAAVLHDLVEDTDTEPKTIEKKFGPRVRTLVDEVTRRDPTVEETEGMTSDEIWEMRNRELMEEIGRMSREARIIKLADRLCNIRQSLLTREGAKLERYIRQTRQILEAIPRETCPTLWDKIERSIADRVAT